MIEVQLAESLQPAEEAGEADFPIEPALLERAALETLRQQDADPEAEITVLLSDDDHLQALNRQFLDIDAPTDVLSFPSGEAYDPDTGASYLGDVSLSLPRAQEQAQAGGHSLEDELQLLVVHGVLHLLGHDHAEEQERLTMWAAQSEILQRLGSSISGPAL